MIFAGGCGGRAEPDRSRPPAARRSWSLRLQPDGAGPLLVLLHEQRAVQAVAAGGVGPDAHGAASALQLLVHVFHICSTVLVNRPVPLKMSVSSAKKQTLNEATEDDGCPALAPASAQGRCQGPRRHHQRNLPIPQLQHLAHPCSFHNPTEDSKGSPVSKILARGVPPPISPASSKSASSPPAWGRPASVVTPRHSGDRARRKR